MKINMKEKIYLVKTLEHLKEVATEKGGNIELCILFPNEETLDYEVNVFNNGVWEVMREERDESHLYTDTEKFKEEEKLFFEALSQGALYYYN